MKTLLACFVFALFVGAIFNAKSDGDENDVTADSGPALAHMVFFEIKDHNDEAIDAVIDACNEHLTDHDGTLYYSAGRRADGFDRDVNDTQFDVALHLVFKDKAAHDKYATHPRHLKFIKENAQHWAGVRVFDSYLTPAKDPS